MRCTDPLVLSLDVMDISGEHQTDLEHDITKTRLSKDGRVLEVTKSGREYCALQITPIS
jgi:hypothetical protein